MGTILTASGRDLDLIYPRVDAICIGDIAAALSKINRFCGHTRRPYSVAEHSLLVLQIIDRLFPHVDVHGRLAALMHDAHEAYIGDVSSPAKQVAGDGWWTLEHRLERTVRTAFALHGPAHTHSVAIKQADMIALATERKQLMPASATLWPCLVHVEPVTWVDLMAADRCAITCYEWADRFAAVYTALDEARNSKLFPVVQP